MPSVATSMPIFWTSCLDVPPKFSIAPARYINASMHSTPGVLSRKVEAGRGGRVASYCADTPKADLCDPPTMVGFSRNVRPCKHRCLPARPQARPVGQIPIAREPGSTARDGTASHTSPKRQRGIVDSAITQNIIAASIIRSLAALRANIGADLIQEPASERPRFCVACRFHPRSATASDRATSGGRRCRLTVGRIGNPSRESLGPGMFPSAGRLGERFIALARSVYQQNDRRAAIKRRINERLGYEIMEAE